MPCDYKKYPKNWKQLRAAVLDRANHRCELCFCENGALFLRDREGYPWPDPEHSLQPQIRPVEHKGLKKVRIVLTIHHINHNIKDNRLPNLIALCQRCHLRLDLPWRHKKSRQRTN